MGVDRGDTLLAHVDEGRIVLEKAESVKRRLKARFAVLGKKASLADELIADRRAEARRELDE
jgi:bifunctional DNA-binding transcriptional regulator/antitoxin component of YhaV-PrlF toxin-antitoxin module